MNQINVIHPYCDHGVWVFDDKEKGLVKEALVGGVPEIIALSCMEFEIKDPLNGFTILFSHSMFAGSQFSLKWLEGDGSGNTYLYDRNGVQQTGWLCPALFRYFTEAPKELFIQLKSRPGV